MIKELEGKKPKKALSAYMIFVRETRTKVCQSNPGMHALQVMKEVGKAWQNLKPSEKLHFETQAEQDKQRFKQEMKEFGEQLLKLKGGLNTATQEISDIHKAKIPTVLNLNHQRMESFGEGVQND